MTGFDNFGCHFGIYAILTHRASRTIIDYIDISPLLVTIYDLFYFICRFVVVGTAVAHIQVSLDNER